MKNLNRLITGALALFAGVAAAQGQTLVNVQSALLHVTTNEFQRGANWQSQNGVPLSSTAGTPVGSDGRILAGSPPRTGGQFQGVVSYSAVTVAANPTALNTTASFAANADAIDWPRSGLGGTVRLILRAQAGASWISQDTSFLFGSVIPVPDRDILGNPLDAFRAANYWEPEPFTSNNHEGQGYYYSPHAKKVYAIQAGDVRVVWRSRTPLPSRPTDYEGNEDVRYAFLGGSYYDLLPTQQIVSEGTVKLTRKLYWTESIFSAAGVRVAVPSGVVKDVRFGYNAAIPRYVPSSEAFVAAGTSSALGTNTVLLDTRTIWWENGFINAFNKEGRIFVELLGGSLGNGAREHLGFELVDVTREPLVEDVTTELGERLTAYSNNSPSDDHLRPSPVISINGPNYLYQRFVGGDGHSELYATRVTPELNSSTAHWLEQGVAGLWWPARFVRYRQIWPAEVAKYSHYVRPLVANEAEAQNTAIAVPVENAPVIEYEDPTDQIRSKLRGDERFYTYLDPDYPALRTLLRYSSGDRVAFERVFSWLDANLRTEQFTGSVAAELSEWNSGDGGGFSFSDVTKAPRVVNATAWVGQRLTAPAGEPQVITVAPDGEPATNGVPAYLAGHIQKDQGTGYSVTAYKDPFEVGFYEASSGSIIPINAGNNDAVLEVWWYRPNAPDEANGFLKTFWPSTIVRYNIQWPTNVPFSREIVLASNAGSEALTSLEARGAIYFQNDPSKPGYNPNEEHALLQGGQVWALRDDLNITNEAAYSSHSYVLLEYADADGRPSMTSFQVLREKGNIVFDYTSPAGMILQAPMPLPLLERPLGARLVGTPARSLNTEVKNEIVASSHATDADGISLVTLTTTRRHFFQSYETLALQNTSSGSLTTRWFYSIEAVGTASTLGGVVSVATPLPLGIWTASPQPSDLTLYRFRVTSTSGLTANAPVLVANPVLRDHRVATIEEVGSVSGDHFVEIRFVGNAPEGMQSGSFLVLPDSGFSEGAFAGWRLAYEALPEAITDPVVRERFASFTYQDRKGDTWFYRGPHNADAGGKTLMQYYYKTLDGFYFPSLSFASQPPIGVITPYLRSRNPDGSFVGDPVYGDVDGDNLGDGNSLGIVYRPVWPETTPVLMMAESLTTPKRGLPAVRGQTSINLLYQQPQSSGGLSAHAVVLHDPTREKQFHLAGGNSAGALNKLPDSVRTSTYQGAIFFPNLPPHLVDRFFYDPNRGVNGALVLRGQYVDEVVGDDYLLLNVLGPQDSEALRNLCLADDPLKSHWDHVILNGLRATLQKFVEDAGRPGTFKVGSTESVGPGALAEVRDQDIAVDSYALTASGPGTGYVTLVMGDGFAFTPAEEPVSLQVIRVVDTLYPGQLKIVKPSNPLSEMLTLQQVVDLGGKVNDFEFEWLIAAPVQGVPPPVYQNTRQLLVGNGTWNHLQFPRMTDRAATVHLTDPARLVNEVTTQVTPVSLVPFVQVSTDDENISLVLKPGQPHPISVGVPLIVRDPSGNEIHATVAAVTETIYQSNVATNILLTLDAEQDGVPAALSVAQVYERSVSDQPQSTVFREFTLSHSSHYSQLTLSLDLDPTLAVKVYLDGQLVVTANTGAGDTSTALAPSGFSPLSHVYPLESADFSRGMRLDGQTAHRIAVEFYSGARPGVPLAFNLRLEAFESVDQTAQPGSQWLALDPLKFRDKVRAVLGTGADVRALSDNYLIARYRATNATHASFSRGFSRWTEPQLAEGWIKRVLAGINPFNQRVTDLFNNSVNTDASILTQAGRRWEGDVALNLESINEYGLIEIYETVLRRGRGISIDAGINYGPANDALLLAAGYLNDLYVMLGNEAWADASNPTIGVGTKENDIATALFAFRGQMPTLLEEELSLLRGRDDSLQPGVQARPVYNRMFWNYTRGIDAGEVIYALNYNIKPLPGSGVIDAAAAAHLYPQGHGDAYGHYLTATKKYVELFMSRSFDWVPHSETVTVLGQPVQVNYQNERKFAAAASALARVGSQVLDLTWRRDYVPGGDSGWESLELTATNTTRQVPTTRYWGVDAWASRSMQATYFNWIVGNAILPAVDPDPTHEGIQKVDRTTVPELLELPDIAEAIQLTLENAEAHAMPLGLSSGSLVFDINPNQVIDAVRSQTHFEQIYERARRALNNAVVSFDDAKNVTRQMRVEEDDLAEFQAAVLSQEQAYTNQLIEIFGTPYPEDIGPGKSYDTGYAGPDLLHFAYVNRPELSFSSTLEPRHSFTYEIDFSRRVDLISAENLIGSGITLALSLFKSFDLEPLKMKSRMRTVKFTLDSDGFFQKPDDWKGKRQSPGKIQDAVANVMLARNALGAALNANEAASQVADQVITRLLIRNVANGFISYHEKQKGSWELYQQFRTAKKAIKKKLADSAKKTTEKLVDAAATAPPTSLIAGVAAGGDATSGIRSGVKAGAATSEAVKDAAETASDSIEELTKLRHAAWTNFVAQGIIRPLLVTVENAPMLEEAKNAVKSLDATLYEINKRLVEYDQAVNNYRTLVAGGERILSERQIFRQRTATLIQGYRTRDAAFRIFRDEKLERYKTLFELAAKYTYLAANAYDYETGLLNTEKGKRFVNRIINSRALGIVKDGEPQYAGSNTGDPGLSSVLAEMGADWDVLRGRLGFNNPTRYGTTVSLRTENFRIVSGSEGDIAWKDALNNARRANILEDSDVARYCMQIDPGNGLPVPGLVVEFSTTVTDSLNLFGRELAAGDHYFDSSYFATKIFSVGVVFEGYKGMDNPLANSGAVGFSGGLSPADPTTSFLDAQGLAATPGIYLIPVGIDSMRSPPLGDESTIRTWTVNDITIPLPFNIGGSAFSTKPQYVSSDSLTEPLFGLRKHPAFRPVSTTSVFDGKLMPSQFTNTRLIGRSVWNSRWKLVIPGYKLLHDPNAGLDRYVQTVKDIKLHLVTYSYAGN